MNKCRHLGYSLLAMISPIPINKPPNKNKGVTVSPRKIAPKIVPTTGWAKKDSEAKLASRRAKAVFHRYMARAVAIMPRKRIPAITPRVISPNP